MTKERKKWWCKHIQWLRQGSFRAEWIRLGDYYSEEEHVCFDWMFCPHCGKPRPRRVE